MTGEAPAYVGAVERVLSLVTDRIIAVSSGLPHYPDPGPDRAALLKAIA